MFIPHHEIERLIFRALDLEVENVSAFSYNHLHAIYDIKTRTKNIVLRISSEKDLNNMQGSIHCLKLLKDNNIPVPDVLYVNETLDKFKYYFIIIERIEGIDLGFVYPNLTIEKKRNLAEDIINLQNKVANIDSIKKINKPGKMFTSEKDLSNASWYGYISDTGEMAINLEDKSLFDIDKIHQFEEIAFMYKDLLNKVEIQPYLEGVTAKNVIMQKFNLSGVVDIDYISFGDSLMQIALTKMMLLRAGYDLYYTDFWIYESNLKDEQYVLLDIYLLRYCLQFMSDIGYRNKHQHNNRMDNNKEIFRLNNLFNSLFYKLKHNSCNYR